jgi:hypothetical protein
LTLNVKNVANRDQIRGGSDVGETSEVAPGHR